MRTMTISPYQFQHRFHVVHQSNIVRPILPDHYKYVKGIIPSVEKDPTREQMKLLHQKDFMHLKVSYSNAHLEHMVTLQVYHPLNVQVYVKVDIIVLLGQPMKRKYHVVVINIVPKEVHSPCSFDMDSILQYPIKRLTIKVNFKKSNHLLINQKIIYVKKGIFVIVLYDMNVFLVHLVIELVKKI